MGWTCDTIGKKRSACGNLILKSERELTRRVGVYENVVLKYILKEKKQRVWSGFIWYRMVGSSGIDNNF
jgi:hypothetical protein